MFAGSRGEGEGSLLGKLDSWDVILEEEKKSGVKLGESRTHTSSQLKHSGITVSSDFIWFMRRQLNFLFSSTRSRRIPI